MIQIDTENEVVIRDNIRYPFSSEEAFKIISDVWLRLGWDSKYVYSFSWMGRPIIQLPEDLVRIQEVIYNIKPDVIIETGVAHGGSLIFYATLCKAMEKGKAIEEHILAPFITLIEGSSTDQKVVSNVSKIIKPDDTILVILDSNHSYSHVLLELELYSKLVSIGSYIVATDGIMEYVVGGPRTQPDWINNNPKKAAEEFVKDNPNFIFCEPVFPFNEGLIKERVTYWPFGFIKRIK